MKYTESHEWIQPVGEIGTVGVSEYAQKELGDIVFVELPKIGADLEAGEEAGVLESTKAAADIYAPVSGTITEVNETLTESPEIINQSPEKDGWLFKMRITNPAELETLLDRSDYEAQIS